MSSAPLVEPAAEVVSAGVTPDGASRRVSLHDGDARPIAKGRLGKPVEFGYKAQVVDNDGGVVLDDSEAQGNLADAPRPSTSLRMMSSTTPEPTMLTGPVHGHDGSSDTYACQLVCVPENR